MQAIRSTKSWALVLGICTLALLFRIIVGISQQSLYWSGGDITYFHIAQSIVDHGQYALAPGRPTLWRGPVYPLYLVFLYAAFGQNTLAFIIGNAVINVMVVAATFFLAQIIFDQRTAIVAALLVALYPYLVWQSGSIIENGAVSLIVITFMLAMIKTERTGSPRWSFASGVLAAAGILTKSVMGLFVVLAVGWWLVYTLVAKKFRFRNLLIFAFALALSLLPWLLRNIYSTGTVTIAESNAGENLWKGNNHLTFSIYPEYSLDSLGPFQTNMLPAPFESEQEKNEWYFELATHAIMEDPERFLVGLARKAILLYDWQIVPRIGVNAQLDIDTGVIVAPGPGRSLFERMLYTIPYVAALLLAGIGLILSWRTHTKELVLLLLAFFTWTIVHALFFSYTRYRMQLEPLLLILSARGIMLIVSKYRPIRRATPSDERVKSSDAITKSGAENLILTFKRAPLP